MTVRTLLLVPVTLIACAGMALAQPASTPAQPAKPATPATPATPIKPTDKPSDKKEADVTLKVGDKAPAIAVDKWVKGDAVKGFDKGKIYVVEFWATWCGPCIAQMPHMTEMQKKFKDVTFMSIAASERKPKDGADTRLATVEKFVKENDAKMGYRVAYDGKRAMGDAWMRAAGQGGIPCAFLVNGEGKIAWIGHPSKLEGEIEKLVPAAKASAN